MDKRIKLNGSIVLGTIIWILLIILFATIAKTNWKDSAANKQLVVGLIPTICSLFLFKLLLTIKILKNNKQLTASDKLYTWWALISGDFIFTGVFLVQKYIKK